MLYDTANSTTSLTTFTASYSYKNGPRCSTVFFSQEDIDKWAAEIAQNELYEVHELTEAVNSKPYIINHINPYSRLHITSKNCVSAGLLVIHASRNTYSECFTTSALLGVAKADIAKINNKMRKQAAGYYSQLHV